MRKIEFKELKLKHLHEEGQFYKNYLKRVENNIEENSSFQMPSKQYEIFYLNILEGKIILLNKEYIQNNNLSGQEVFYNYSIAKKIYHLMLDIQDLIEDEEKEKNELYKRERLEKSDQITELKKEDDRLFSQAIEKYNIIKNSDLYTQYLELQEENRKLKEKNEELQEELEQYSNLKTTKLSFFKKIRNKVKNKKERRKIGEKGC